MLRRPWGPWGALLVLLAALALGSLGAEPRATTAQVTWTGGGSGQESPPTPGAAQPTSAAPGEQSTEHAYLEWLQAHQQRQLAVVQTVPTALDLANVGWRRDLALALDSWGALIQQARDQRPPPTAQAPHRTLLDALDHLDRARRQLLVAAVTGDEPGPDWAATLRTGRDGVAAAADQGRALAEGRPAAARPTVSPSRGNMRLTVLGTARPYEGRGSPADPGYEYFVVRLRLESVAGEPVNYDAFHFRLRAADQTLLNPVPLGLPDELLYGALEGNRLAGEIVGNLAFPVPTGVPATALFYVPDPGEPPLEIPLGPPRPPATAIPTRAAAPTTSGGS
jgi:hypothetical protein